MKHQFYRKLALLFIKYTPAIMSITCSLKIHILARDTSSEYFNSVEPINWVNLLLELFVIAGVYVLGKVFNYCWKHRSLCRISTYGYIAYIIFLVFDIKCEYVYYLTVFYVLFVLFIVIIYYGTK